MMQLKLKLYIYIIIITINQFEVYILNKNKFSRIEQDSHTLIYYIPAHENMKKTITF